MPTLLVGASLVAVAVTVVVEVVVLATAGLLGALGDEVVRIAAVVAPGVLPPLLVVVDTMELADEKAQVVIAQRLQLLICNRGWRGKRKAKSRVSVRARSTWATRAMLLEGGAPLSLARVWLSTSVALSLLKSSFMVRVS